MSDDIAVSVKNVSKRFLLPHEKKNSVKSLFTSAFSRKTTYSNQQALKDISFDIKKGEFFGIVGRNGSGKSTLLKIIAGIYQPTKGKVITNGKLVPFIELGVGFNPELTGRENVFLNGAILGFTRNQIKQNCKKIVSFAELEDHMDVKLKNYSSGMQVRLAFACATMAKADILLIDEVLAVGDADFQRKCFNYFKQLKKNGTTVIFVTHDMSAVREYCDRGCLINDSTIAIEGTSEIITEHYSKLFSNEEGNISNKFASSERWGLGNIRFRHAPIITIQKELIKILIEIECFKDTPEYIIGFSISLPSGEDIMGINSKLLKQKLGGLKKGDKHKFEWVFDNIFSSGIHSCNLACISTDGANVFDWWNDAGILNINNDKNSPYLVTPQITLKDIN